MAAATPRAGARPLEVPRALQEGDKFVRWDEDSGVGCPVTLKVDQNGFYLYWTDQNNEIDMIDLVTVRDTRNGKNAKIPKDPKLRQIVSMGAQEPLEDKTLTVCYGSDFVNPNFVNFCCSNKETAEMWANEVLRLAYNLVQLNGPTSMFLLKAHTRLTLMADKAGKIAVKNVYKTFAQNKEDRKRVEKAMEASGLLSGKNDFISVSKFQYEDFFTLYKNLTQRSEMETIFDSLCGGSKRKLMTAEQFVDFLNKSQRDPRLNEILYPYANVVRAKDLISQHEPSKSNAQRGMLSLDGFLRYLLSEDNPVVSAAKSYQLDDMDQPLPHYFINSSHNTYLTGHQLTGKSSVEIYRQCLLAGCRCVELDFWNGRTEEPVIVHGYTFVPEISAKEVIEAIAETAFKTSDYPVILSFENHCNTRQQAKIAQYCREFFGDMLLDTPLESFKLEAGCALPPPAALRRKIIIKNKKKHHKKGHAAPSGLAAAAVASALPVTQQHGNGEVPVLLKDNSRESRDEEEPNADDEDESSSEEEEEPEKSANKAPDEKSIRETEAGEELSALVNYVQPVHFTSFENATKKKRNYEMSSFDEKQATTLLKERPIEFVYYNKHQLSRVYPAGTRFDSSNFMPQVFWNAGCQLVALNYQNLDLAMQLNLGIFEYNQRCGYLLKPEYMRRRDRRFDPFAESTVDGIIAGTVSVQVISGQFLTDKRVGTYIEVDMFGLPADTVRKRFKTKIVPANGINPGYEEEPFVFKKVVLPELATIRLTAYEESGRLLGHRVIPVLGLCPGYRQVGLRNEFGQPLGLATVFVHVVVKDFVPDGLSDFAEALANPIKYQSELDKRAQQLSVLTDDMEETEVVQDESANCSTKTRRGQLNSTASSDMAPLSAPASGTLPRASVSVNQTDLQVEEVESVESLSESIPVAKGSPGPTAAQPISASVIAEITAETFEQLLESKMVKEKKAELEKKLESLRKKHEKERARYGGYKAAPDGDKAKGKFYMSHKLVKRLSSKNIEVEEPTETDPESRARSMAREHIAQEKDLQEKYHDAVFSTLEKAMKASQAAQLKTLATLVERETAEVMKKLESARRDEVKALAKIHKDKDEMVRIKREVASSIVEKGVSERVRLKEAYRKRQEELERQHSEARSRLEEERAKSKSSLSREFDGRLAQISEEGGSGT